MSIKLALAGNPNCGKTTLFNALTGSNQFVGNWPGVTVEKKSGTLKGNKEVEVIDLPGIYSLSPYTPEEIVARTYLVDEKPDVILNIIDGTNLERNLYLTTQLLELGIPVVVAVNMMDIVKKNGDKINPDMLSAKLGCEVVTISALKGDGIKEAASTAVASVGKATEIKHSFDKQVEDTLKLIEVKVCDKISKKLGRWYSIKLFEGDEKAVESLKLSSGDKAEITKLIEGLEEKLDDDAESIIINERYTYIASIIGACCKKSSNRTETTSDKIDKVVTNRWLGLPIFAAVMFIVYYISVTTVGGWATDWANDGVFGDGWHLFGIGTAAYEEALEVDEDADPADYGIWVEGVPVIVEDLLVKVDCAEWLQGLILDGIIAGVGAVLGFVPQMIILFLFLAFMEACGYMARVAFVMDRIFRRFGLSGKSFIPMLIGSGCGVPGVMASRTIENERDRRMTVMTTTFIPCGAKLPIIALIAGALFDGAWWVAPSAYFVGVLAIIISGVILKKTSMFAGDVAPFVMELPAYHMPTVGNVLRSVWERASSFVKKAGTIILFATILVWFSSNFGFGEDGFGMVDMNDSILAKIGSVIAPLFSPIGWGNWKAAVAAVTGLIAKENVVGTFGVLYSGLAEVSEDGNEIWTNLQAAFSQPAAYSFLVFNLLCAPCFAAMGAIRREMNSAKWTTFAIGYQCVFAYIVAFIVYQVASFVGSSGNVIGFVCALAVIAVMLYLIFRKDKRAVKEVN